MNEVSYANRIGCGPIFGLMILVALCVVASAVILLA